MEQSQPNDESATYAFTRKILLEAFVEQTSSATTNLGCLAVQAGPQYWDLNSDNKENIPRAVVIAISGNDKEIEEAIKFVRSIRTRQVNRGCVFQSSLVRLSDMDD